uniref:hypothetical protein n=1 Tax=Psychotria serpens TaxID=77896 RepID=UPI0022FD94C9|nr:hypothetical protein PNX05_pgp055 [Psychotria serpens]UIG86828.1 hypothetical protein [Psychotria serpens]
MITLSTQERVSKSPFLASKTTRKTNTLSSHYSRIYIYPFYITDYFCLISNLIGFDFESKTKLLIHFMTSKDGNSKITTSSNLHKKSQSSGGKAHTTVFFKIYIL